MMVFFIAFFVRMSQVVNLFPKIEHDAAAYDRLGKAIVEWGLFTTKMFLNFPTTDHPIYPLFLGTIFSVFGVNYFAVLVVQSFVGSLLCVLIYFFAKELFDKRIALFAAYISAFYPIFVKLCNTLLSEQIFIIFFVFSIWQMIKYIKYEKLCFLIFSAVSLGLATLTRSVSMLFIFALFPYLGYLRTKGKMKKIIVPLFLFFVFFAGTISLQTIRNYYVSDGKFIPVTEAPSRDLYVSFRPFEEKNFGIRPADDPVIIKGEKIESMKERNLFYVSKTKEAIIEDIVNNPVKLLLLEIRKVAHLWSPISWEILGLGEARYNFGFVFILPFFIYGLALLIKRRMLSLTFMIILPILYFQFLHLVYFGLPRFRIGFEPSLIIIAAFGIDTLFTRFSNKKLFISILGLFLILNILLFIYSPETKIFLREICERIGLW